MIFAIEVVDIFGREKKRTVKNIALFVDGPNIIRKEFSIDLDELRRRVQKYGRIITGKVFLNQFASDKLVEAIANQGFEPAIMLAGEKTADVDVSVAVAAMEAGYDSNIDMVAIASRDADYLPAVQAIKKLGKEILIIGAEPGFSKALQRGADYVELLQKKGVQPQQRQMHQQVEQKEQPKSTS
ncbi:MAG TPA: TIGR00288 family NYN domain-containing protein [archaeon]|nr:TIGR00288 family NYN domain-containing protein [archaeon]